MDLRALRNRVETIQNLATIPSVAKRLLEIVGKPAVSLGEISDFVSHDPALAAKVLKMVNSPVYGFPGRIASVNQAVLLLGLNVLRGLLVGVTVFDLMQKAMIGLRDHSLGCAIFSRIIARRKGLKDPEELFIFGLLHDIGKMVLVFNFPKEYAKVMDGAQTKGVTVYDVEPDFFSTTHATVGAWVTEQWSFPKPLIDVIGFHHRPHLAKVAPMETAIVHFSDIILRARGFGFAGDTCVPPLSPYAWDTLGLTEDDIKEVLKEAEDLLEEAADLSF
jgi:putative nucleotidyltransferase with HDIG domain